MKNTSALQTEWQLLQNQCDSYEKYGLIIKLVCLASVALYLANDYLSLWLLVLTLCFWGQNAIWNTFQSRIEQRLLILESAINSENGQATKAFQFQSEFLANRPNAIKLMFEYGKNALRPTVAFPYVVIVIAFFIKYFSLI
ncbi:hypothetical protein [Thalassotalea ganghwensis]